MSALFTSDDLSSGNSMRQGEPELVVGRWRKFATNESVHGARMNGLPFWVEVDDGNEWKTCRQYNCRTQYNLCTTLYVVFTIDPGLE